MVNKDDCVYDLIMEWTNRTRIINDVVRVGGAVSYLEIGYGDGANYAAIRCRRKWSVDPAEGGYAAAKPTHRMTSDAFFEDNEEKFDVIFIDGLHHADQVERDLKNSLAALAPGGVVICHDLNPTSEGMQAVPRSQQEWTGEVASKEMQREPPQAGIKLFIGNRKAPYDLHGW